MKNLKLNCLIMILWSLISWNAQSALMCENLFKSKLPATSTKESDVEPFTNFDYHVRFYPSNYIYSHSLTLIGRHIINFSEYNLLSVHYNFKQVDPGKVVLKIENWSNPENIDFIKYGSKLIKKILKDSKEGIGGVKIEKIEIKIQDEFTINQLKELDNINKSLKKKDQISFIDALKQTSVVKLLAALGFKLKEKDKYVEKYNEGQTVTLEFEK